MSTLERLNKHFQELAPDQQKTALIIAAQAEVLHPNTQPSEQCTVLPTQETPIINQSIGQYTEELRRQHLGL